MKYKMPSNFVCYNLNMNEVTDSECTKQIGQVKALKLNGHYVFVMARLFVDDVRMANYEEYLEFLDNMLPQPKTELFFNQDSFHASIIQFNNNYVVFYNDFDSDISTEKFYNVSDFAHWMSKHGWAT